MQILSAADSINIIMLRLYPGLSGKRNQKRFRDGDLAPGICFLFPLKEDRAGRNGYDKINLCTGKYRISCHDIPSGSPDLAVSEELGVSDHGTDTRVHHAGVY